MSCPQILREKIYRESLQILHVYLQKLKILHGFATYNAENPRRIPAISNSLQILQWKSDCGDFKNTGIAGIHAIPINLKSLHSDFPVESL